MTPTLHPAFALVTDAAQQHGAGSLLRIVLVVLLIGATLVAWFLLRGYRGAGLEEGGQDDGNQGGGRPGQGGDGGGPGGAGRADHRPREADGGKVPRKADGEPAGPGEAVRQGRRGTAGDHPGEGGSGGNHPGNVTAAVSQDDGPASDSA